MNRMTRPLSMHFDFWMGEECELILEIQKLKGVNTCSQEEVMAAIEILEALDSNLYGLLIEHEVFFDETGIGTICTLYRQSIDSLKFHEGVDFLEAGTAFCTALRLIQLMVGLLYDACIGAKVPTAVRELI